jgi:hypothetical protein
MNRRFLGRVLASMMACAGLALLGFGLVAAAPASGQRGVFPPNSHPHGHSYAQWSAKWWQWALGLPVAGHPFIDSPDFDVTEGQTGNVWFLASPAPGTVQRTCTIPAGKSLFVALLNSEWSSLEGFATEAEQRDFAIFFGDHIGGLFCTIDGVPVANLGAFRFQSPQFTFSAPSPWIFGDTGGTGTTVADGYYVFLHRLHAGQHVLHYGGTFHFAVAEGDPFDYDAAVDMTYNLTQLGRPGDDDNDE